MAVSANCLRVDVVRASRSGTGTGTHSIFRTVPTAWTSDRSGTCAPVLSVAFHGGEHTVGGTELAQRTLTGAVALGERPAVGQAGGAGRVLGGTDVVAAPVDRHGLVGEPAQRLDRLRVPVGGVVEGVDLEDVAVVLLERTGGGELLGLLTGQPGVPGRLAARAVGGGAGDADALGDAVAVPVDLDDRAAARSARVLGQAREVRHGQAERVDGSRMSWLFTRTVPPHLERKVARAQRPAARRPRRHRSRCRRRGRDGVSVRRTCASSTGASLHAQPAPWLNCVRRQVDTGRPTTGHDHRGSHAVGPTTT